MTDGTRHRVGIMSEVLPVLREMGHDPRAVLTPAGIDPGLLRDTEGEITLAQVGAIFGAGVAATGCEHFPLLVGLRGTTTHLGRVGRLMRSAPTLGQALLDICENQRRYIRGAVTYLLVQDGVAHWGYGIHEPGVPDNDLTCESTVGVGVGLMRELAGVTPARCSLHGARPRHPAPIARYWARQRSSKPRSSRCAFRPSGLP
jgi:hypothetical protein